MKIVLIGAGNVATHLGQALVGAGYKVVQVWSRTAESAQMLAERLGCNAVTEISKVRNDADAYILSVVDDAIQKIVPELCQRREKSLFLHTAGSVSMSCFEGYASSFGVLYPMQTFSKNKQLNFKEIPVFVEASDEHSQAAILKLANSISDRVYLLDEEGRKWLHLSAVFACNFSNYCCAVAEKLLQKRDIPFDVMLPLFDETARKLHKLSPVAAQTGPASRNDVKVMERQAQLLADDNDLQAIYQLMSKGIIQNSENNKKR
jgi:predicted short-subunit dehydrogenase-like oxidoreductase (DUF2520 family)